MAYVDFKKLKARVPISALLEHYDWLADLEETNQGFKGKCPFCGSGSFKVSIAKNTWFCFGKCKNGGGKNGGNILDFVMAKEGDGLMEAAQRIDRWFPETETKEDNEDNKPEKDEDPPGAAGGVGETELQPEASAVEADEPPEGAVNKPLSFTLKSVTFDHPSLNALGISRETLGHFGVGYFTGKGTMHNRVVFPLHNKDGELVAYAGYSPEDNTYKYPDKTKFDPRLELYNLYQAANAGNSEHSLMIVTDLLNVLRLYELRFTHVVAIPTKNLYAPQLALIDSLLGKGGVIDYVPWTLEYVDTLATLVTRFHVRLHRYYEGSEDEFLSQVVHSIG